MKKNIRKVLAVAISLIATSVTAQQELSSAYFMEGAIFRHELNPAFDNQQSYFSFLPLGHLGVGVKGNFGLKDLLFYRNGKTVTYLHPEDARRLVTEPIIRASGRSDIFYGKAVERVLYYSASSAFYTQWICSELIKYANLCHLSHITEVDVEECVHRMLRSSEDLDKFSPLEYSGRDPVESRFTPEQTRDILFQVARGENDDRMHGCAGQRIQSHDAAVQVNDILKELVNRRVLLEEEQGYYKLKVKLYLLVWKMRNT